MTDWRAGEGLRGVADTWSVPSLWMQGESGVMQSWQKIEDLRQWHRDEHVSRWAECHALDGGEHELASVLARGKVGGQVASVELVWIAWILQGRALRVATAAEVESAPVAAMFSRLWCLEVD